MNPQVDLVLGSGGARGLAHIGVIRELEQRHFKTRSIAGCSMGALIGGFHAAGRLAAYEEWVTELSEWDILRFLDVSLTARQGMMKGDLIMKKMRSLVGDRRIEDLPIEFAAIATDIHRRKEVWIRSGDLFDAIRASIAVPGIFTPLKMGDRTLVDGGLINPLPVTPTSGDAARITIAVSLAGPRAAEPFGPNVPPARKRSLAKYRERIDDFLKRAQASLGVETTASSEDEQATLSDILISAFVTMQEAIARYRLASWPPDLLIEIPSNTCEAHEFYKARQVIAAGRHWTRRALDRWDSEWGKR